MNHELEKLKEKAREAFPLGVLDISYVDAIVEKAFTLGREEERRELLYKVEALDYYWQREHQDRVLVSLDEVQKLLQD